MEWQQLTLHHLKGLLRGLKTITTAPLVLRDWWRFRREYLKGNKRFTLHWKDLYPQPFDKTALTGFDRHYVYHTAWAARKVREINPDKHIDIASSLYFPAITSAFIPVEFYDYRPADLVLENLTSGSADLTKLHFADDSVASLSCLHTIEHIGLGRYGDPIDPDGDRKALAELERVLAPGGSLLVVVPMGNEARIEFNAHRIYTYDLVVSAVPSLEVKEFSLIPEHAGGVLTGDAAHQCLAQERYAAGCFWFVKPKSV